MLPTVSRSILIVVGLLFTLGLGNRPAPEPDEARRRLLDAKSQMNRAFYSHDAGALIESVDLFRPFTASGDPEIRKLAYYYMGYASYRIASAFDELDEETTGEYQDEAIRYIEKSTEVDGTFAEAIALLGNCYGMKATGFFSGMKYGPKSQRALDRAVELAPDNPRVRLLYGISFMFKPKVFGGSLERAIAEMRRAAELFRVRAGDDGLYPGWGDVEVYAWLGNAHERAGEPDLASRYYRQALELDPDYYWVKEILLPELIEKRG